MLGGRGSVRSFAPAALDLGRDGARVLVLPRSDDEPAVRHQRRRVPPVAAPVGVELGPPPLGVRFWRDRVLGTAVPETAVDEDRDPCSGEDDVRSALDTLSVDPEAQAPAVQFPADGQLRFGPRSPQAGHEALHRWTRCRRSGGRSVGTSRHR